MERVLSAINNYFYKFGEVGTFEIVDNTVKVTKPFVKGQYIRVLGSVLNDNVYVVEGFENGVITLYGAENEVFEGVIYSLAIPTVLIGLIPKIEQFENENKPSNIVSESFGNYSYSLNTTTNGQPATWVNAFHEVLRPYRKMYDSKRGVRYHGDTKILRNLNLR